MYRRLSGTLFPILLVALVGLGVWGYQEHREKNAILINAENNYQRAFHDLSYNMDKLHSELGNTLAVNTTSYDFFKKNLINVWRLTAQAQSNVNQLPLSLLPFHKTDEFLANAANFAYQTSVRDLSNEPLSEDEKATLFSLYEHSKEINKDLRDVQSEVLNQHLRWMDVETALAKGTDESHIIIDGFRKVDKKVSEFPEINWGPSAKMDNKTRSFQALSGDLASEDEVLQKAGQLLGMSDTRGFNIGETGSESGLYSLSGINPHTGNEVQMDYTKKGGQLVWFTESRDVADKVLDVRGARDAAIDFSEQQGYSALTPVSYDEYGNVATLTLVPNVGDVLIYPAQLSIQVALDNGDIIGLQTTDYIYEHKERDIQTAKLSEEEARKYLNPQFEIEESNRALIKNELNQETLCYQYFGSVNGGKYRVFINAETGQEEKVEPVKTDV